MDRALSDDRVACEIGRLREAVEVRLAAVDEREREVDDEQLGCEDCETVRKARKSEMCHAHNAWLSQINGRKLELEWFLKELGERSKKSRLGPLVTEVSKLRERVEFW